MSSIPLTARKPLLSPAVAAAIGCAVCLSLSLISLFMGTFPLFLRPVSTEFGWGHSVYPQAPMLVGVVGVIAGPFIGRMLDRHGVRKLVPAGLALWLSGLFALSFMDGSIMRLYLFALAVAVGGTVAGPIAFAKVINGWFDRNRGLALGIVMSAVPAVATAMVVPVSQGLIDGYGWRATYRLMAIGAAIIAIPVAVLLVREAPSVDGKAGREGEAEGQGGWAVFLSRDFIVVAGASCMGVGALMGVNNHFLGWMAEKGVGKEAWTIALSLYSLVGPLAPLLGGFLVDRIPNAKILAAFYALGPIGMALLLLGGSATTIPGMVLLGLCFSGIHGFTPYLVSRYFGRKAGSEILAVTFALLTVGMGVGPILIGFGRDLVGGYVLPMTIATIVMLFSFALALCFGPFRFDAPGRP